MAAGYQRCKNLTESKAEELSLLKSQLELLCADCTSNLESRLFASKFKLATNTSNQKQSKATDNNNSDLSKYVKHINQRKAELKK